MTRTAATLGLVGLLLASPTHALARESYLEESARNQTLLERRNSPPVTPLTLFGNQPFPPFPNPPPENWDQPDPPPPMPPPVTPLTLFGNPLDFPPPPSNSEYIRSQFDAHIAAVRSIEDYRRHLREENIHYSTPTDRAMTYSGDPDNELYANPLTTYEREHGVCDELALYFSAFFAGKKGYKVSLIHFPCDNFDCGHAAAIYRHPSGKWGYSDNTDVSDPIFKSQREAIGEVLDQHSTLPTTPVSVSRALKSGEWMYHNSPTPDKYPFPYTEMSPINVLVFHK